MRPNFLECFNFRVVTELVTDHEGVQQATENSPCAAGLSWPRVRTIRSTSLSSQQPRHLPLVAMLLHNTSLGRRSRTVVMASTLRRPSNMSFFGAATVDSCSYIACYRCSTCRYSLCSRKATTLRMTSTSKMSGTCNCRFTVGDVDYVGHAPMRVTLASAPAKLDVASLC